MYSQEGIATNTVQPAFSLNGFQFLPRRQKIDWRRVASVDVEKVVRDIDVDTLQQNISHVTFCNIEEEVDMETIDPNFIKLFKLAQLSIEYLMHSQDFLLQSSSESDEKLKILQEQLEEEKKFRDNDQDTIKQLQRENRKRRRIIENQQLEMLKTNKTSRTCSPCPYCPKMFVNLSYLQSHVVRRHPGKQAPTDEWSSQREFPIKSRVSLPEEFNSEFNSQDLKKELGELRMLLEEERKSLQDLALKRHEDLLSKEEEMRREFEKWKSEQLMNKDHLESKLYQELEELKRKYKQSQQALNEIRVKPVHYTAEREVRVSSPAKASTREMEVQATFPDPVSDRLIQQLNLQQAELNHRLRKQERQLEDKINSLTKEISSLSKANVALEQKLHLLEVEGIEHHMEQKKEKKHFSNVGTETTGMNVKVPSRTANIIQKQIPLVQPIPAPRRTPFIQNMLDRNQPPVPPRPDATTGPKLVHSTPVKDKKKYMQRGSVSRYNERVKPTVKSTPNFKEAIKEELKEELKDKIMTMGLDMSKESVAASLYCDCINRLKSERKSLAEKHKNLYDLRNHFSQQADLKVSERLKGRSSDITWLYQLPSEESFKKLATSTPVKVVNRSPARVTVAVGSSNSRLVGSSSSSSDESESNSDSKKQSSIQPFSSKEEKLEGKLVLVRPSHVPPQRRKAFRLVDSVSQSDDDYEDHEKISSDQHSSDSASGPEEVHKHSKTRISDLVESIESQLLKRTNKPPPGSVNTVEVHKSAQSPDSGDMSFIGARGKHVSYTDISNLPASQEKVSSDLKNKSILKKTSKYIDHYDSDDISLIEEIL